MEEAVTGSTQSGALQQEEPVPPDIVEEGDQGKSTLSLPTSLLKMIQTSDTEHEGQAEISLHEDVFSLFYLGNSLGHSFFYSLFVYVSQMVVILLIMSDLVDFQHNDNPLRIPPGVNTEVSIAQAIAMVLALATQTNFLTGLSRLALFETYDHEYVCSIYPQATKTKYLISAILQMVAGLAMLVDSFILNMQATTVLSLMLNFAALSFVSDIQSIAFWVAANGYLSSNVLRGTRRVANFKIPWQQRTKKNIAIKKVVYFVVEVILLACYGVVVHNQRSGKFLCRRIQAQFGDGFRVDLPFFTGLYIQQKNLIAGRAVYKHDKGGLAFFGYCEKEKAWTFSSARTVDTAALAGFKIELTPDENEDPCNYWVKSEETTTYDILETMSKPWNVFDFTTNQTLPIDFFAMICVDCDSSDSPGRQCSGHGICVDHVCQCEDGRLGHTCGEVFPCTKLALDERTNPFPPAAGGSFVAATEYDLLTDNQSNPILSYTRPVYFSKVGQFQSVSIYNLIIFTGLRWGLFLNLEFDDLPDHAKTIPGLSEYLPYEFHTWHSRHRVYFFSEPMKAGTPSFRSTPADLKWFRSERWVNVNGHNLYQVAENQPTDTVLLCPGCRILWNDCLHEGQCQYNYSNPFQTPDYVDKAWKEGGTCLCAPGYGGSLCERELKCTDGANVTCFNGGNCTPSGACSCTGNFVGTLCQYELSEQYLLMGMDGETENSTRW